MDLIKLGILKTNKVEEYIKLHFWHFPKDSADNTSTLIPI